MDLIYTEDKLDNYINKLNMLYPSCYRWQFSQARKDHIDLFGVEIKSNETYFKRSDGKAFDNVQKVSMKSMHYLIYALFNSNFGLSDNLEKLWDKDPLNTKNIDTNL